MRIKTHRPAPTGFTMWLSADDTYWWAHKAGASWPCSELSNRRLTVCVDQNGLYDMKIDGGRGNQDVSGNELTAIVADHLPEQYQHLGLA